MQLNRFAAFSSLGRTGRVLAFVSYPAASRSFNYARSAAPTSARLPALRRCLRRAFLLRALAANNSLCLTRKMIGSKPLCADRWPEQGKYLRATQRPYANHSGKNELINERCPCHCTWSTGMHLAYEWPLAFAELIGIRWTSSEHQSAICSTAPSKFFFSCTLHLVAAVHT